MSESRVAQDVRMKPEQIYIQTQNRLNDLFMQGLLDADEFGYLQIVIKNLKSNDPNCKLAKIYLPYIEHFNLKKFVDDLELAAATYEEPDLYSNMRYRKSAIECVSSSIQSSLTLNLKEHQGNLYLTTELNGYKKIAVFDIDHLITFVKMSIDDRFSKKTYILNEEIKRVSAAAAIHIKSIDTTKNYIIQFDDCYLYNAKVYKGTSPIFPRYFITRSVYHAVEAFEKDGTMPKPNKVTSTALDLALHISNYDRKTFDRLMADSSMVFLNDLDKRAKYAKFVRLYGPTGANGKSEYQKLMARIVQVDNATPFKSSDFSDQFKIGKIVNALLAYEAEDEGKINSNAASLLKQMVSGDALSFREIKQSSEQSRAIATVFSNSNMMLNSSDKTDAFARRLDWFKVNDRYDRTHLGQIHFDNLRTEETSQFMTEYLLVTMLKVLKNNSLPEKSRQMKSTDREFTSNNDSAQDFIEEVGLHSIIGFSVAEIRKKYESWCETNARIELKHKFNATLEGKFGLVRRKLGKNLINPESESYGLIESGTMKQISGWMTAGAKDSYDFDKLDKDGNVEVQLDVIVGSNLEEKTTLEELFGIEQDSKENEDRKEDRENDDENEIISERDESDEDQEDLDVENDEELEDQDRSSDDEDDGGEPPENSLEDEEDDS